MQIISEPSVIDDSKVPCSCLSVCLCVIANFTCIYGSMQEMKWYNHSISICYISLIVSFFFQKSWALVPRGAREVWGDAFEGKTGAGGSQLIFDVENPVTTGQSHDKGGFLTLFPPNMAFCDNCETLGHGFPCLVLLGSLGVWSFFGGKFRVFFFSVRQFDMKIYPFPPSGGCFVKKISWISFIIALLCMNPPKAD